MKSSFLIVLACLLAGCSTVKTVHFDPTQKVQGTAINTAPDPSLLVPSLDPFRLGPGDIIDIEMPTMADSRCRVIVGADGMIYYHSVAGVDVWGKTLGEAKQALEHALKELYLYPSVSVTLDEVHSKCVWVMGRVTVPGLYPLTTPLTVIDILAEAKGLTASQATHTSQELADLSHSFVIRNGHALPVDFKKLLQGDMSQNIYLKPDDLVFIPSALSQSVYVLGSVLRGTLLPYSGNMTILNVIARVGGPTQFADIQHVAIVRGSLASPEIAIVNVKDIIMGKTPDVQVSPHDIIYVPDSPYRTIEAYTKIIIDTFATTAAANAGGRAGSANFQSIGISAPVQ